jgi:hypothetical protein
VPKHHILTTKKVAPKRRLPREPSELRQRKQSVHRISEGFYPIRRESGKIMEPEATLLLAVYSFVLLEWNLRRYQENTVYE